MTRMMPKMSVSPLATRNSSSPYWMLFNTWIRKICRAIWNASFNENAASTGAQRRVQRGESVRHDLRDVLTRVQRGESVRHKPRGALTEFNARWYVAPPGDAPSTHRAATPWIGKRLRGEADGFVLPVLDLTQIEVLHHVVRRRERDLAARAVDLGRGHRPEEQLALADVAADGPQPEAEELRRVIALHRVDVRLAAVGL